MGRAAVAKAFADIDAAYAVFSAEVDGTGSGADADDDPMQDTSDLCLDILAGSARSEPQMAALKAQAAAKYADNVQAMAPPTMSAQAQEASTAAEIACVLTIGPRAASVFLSDSRELTSRLLLTLSALKAGTMSWQHARVMVDETASLDPAGAAALEAHFLDPAAPNPDSGCPAGEMPASRFRHKARIWRERHHEESIEKRHNKGILDRRVEYTPDRDGMAWLSAYLPADQAAATWNRITAISRGLQGPDEKRNLTQIRADVYAAALLGSGTGHSVDDAGAGGNVEGEDPGKVRTPRAEVLVTVPVFSLLGATDEPAMLDGYGPIPASMARDLVANGAESFHRVLVDPRDGASLEISRKSYRPTKAMRRWLRMRDGRCPFPGCSNQSLDNEADHLRPWHQGGTTGVSNLGNPCPRHHRLRHTSGWRPTPATKNEPPGWISPSGRHYTSEHQDWEPPHLPKELQAEVAATPTSTVAATEHGPPQAPPDTFYGHPDIAHIGLSLGEDGLERFLHAHA